jgi:hypothetical protein
MAFIYRAGVDAALQPPLQGAGSRSGCSADRFHVHENDRALMVSE